MKTLVASLLLAAPLFAVEPKIMFAEPALSPDRSEIAFVSGGDIWTVPAAGGEARLLVSHPATESRPVYSPDGKRLAFVSRRTGNGDIYVLTFATGELKRITYDDASDNLDGWSRDGKWLYFSSASQDISGMSDVFRVSSNGGTPMPVAGDRYASEFFSAPSPDGVTLAISARGTASGQWWRHGHSHLDEAEIWLVKGKEYTKFAGGENVQGGEKTLWPMWAADGKGVYYTSDRGGAENIWFRATGAAPKQITQFKNGRLLWPSISYDGKEIVFERDFEIWKVATSGGNAVPVKISRRGQPAGPATEHLTITTGLGDLALSPDNKKIAFISHGEVYAASAKDGGEAARVTRTPGLEQDIAWAPDSKHIVYGSDRDGPWHLYAYDFTTSKETRVTNTTHSDTIPQFSPDGKKIAFQRDGHELLVFDTASLQEKSLAKGSMDLPPFQSTDSMAWSPDSKWIAYSQTAGKSFTNVFVVSTDGGEPRQVSFLSNSNLGSLAWSKDGKFILMISSQRTEPGQVARIDLQPRDPKFREDQFRELFATPPAKPEGGPAGATTGAQADNKAADKKDSPKPVEINFDGIKRRLSLVPLGVSASSVRVSPDGKTMLFVGTTAGQTNLYTYSLDELSTTPAGVRQLTSTPGFKSTPQFTSDSKEVFFMQAGRVQNITIDNRNQKAIDLTAPIDVDFAVEKMEVFREAWAYQNDTFFDPKYNGVDWQAMRTKYEPYAAGATTPDDVRRVINLMIGELNASHMGIGGGGQPTGNIGKLGLRFDRASYEDAGKMRVSEVIALGPAAIAGVKVGDEITAVDGAPTGAGVNFDQLLENKTGKRVALTIGSKEVIIRPVNTQVEKNLLYRQWVEQRRAYVDKISGGKLGYVHLPDMGEASLNQMYIDLDTDNHARQGVVIDIRNNNGGFVNAYALDVLTRRHYLNMTPRGEPTQPARTSLGQRALELPTILVTNQHSLSDAEDFTEGYRALGLGKVVGEPTAGWIIFTSGIGLIDGSTLRLPFVRIDASDGSPMEMHPRPVDIAVTRPVGESYTDRDSQLDAAVKELLRQTTKR